MKEITEEKIDKIVYEVTHEISETIHKAFLEDVSSLPDDLKNNPIAYDEVAVVVSTSNAASIISETLKRLLID